MDLPEAFIMTEPQTPLTPPPTTPMTDRRIPPRGVMPRQIQTWLMLGLSMGILGIILFTGQSARPSRQAGPAPSSAIVPDTGRLRDVQERLRGLNERARQQQQEDDAADDEGENSVTPEPSPPIDPLAAERKRREYESLFAGLAVRKADAEQSRTAFATHRASSAGFDGGALGSIEQIIETAVRAAALKSASPTSSETASGAGLASSTGAPAEMTASQSGEVQRGRRHRLTEGTIIPAVLTNRLDGVAAGPVDCLVTSPVYAADGQQLLVPAGARLLGRATPVQSFGESLLAVAFHRLVMPNEVTYQLDRVVGLNQAGGTRLRDQVDQHYLATFGAASAIGLLSGFSQAFGSKGVGGDSPAVVVVGGAGDANAQVATRVLDRFLNRAPRTIGAGHRVQVYLTADLELPTYGTELVPSQTVH
jgi:type IV secretory pathway VirB10-like protein